MMEYVPDHPDIESCMRTGYPVWNQPVEYQCEACGIELEVDDSYEDEDHEFLCEECVLNLHKKEYLE